MRFAKIGIEWFCGSQWVYGTNNCVSSTLIVKILDRTVFWNRTIGLTELLRYYYYAAKWPVFQGIKPYSSHHYKNVPMHWKMFSFQWVLTNESFVGLAQSAADIDSLETTYNEVPEPTHHKRLQRCFLKTDRKASDVMKKKVQAAKEHLQW